MAIRAKTDFVKYQCFSRCLPSFDNGRKRGLVSKLIGNKGGGVSLSYNFKDAKSYLNIYPSFKEEAETISEMILSELDKDKQEVA